MLETYSEPLPAVLEQILKQVRDMTGMPIEVRKLSARQSIPMPDWDQTPRWMLVMERNGEEAQLGPMDMDAAWWTLYGFMWGCSVTAVDLRDP